MNTIYFDHAATTPLDERVLEAMLPYLTTDYGNASSLHQLGQRAKVALEDARESVAGMLNAEPSEILFTSGGTESNNAAIRGVIEAAGPGREIITSRVEHHAVLHSVRAAIRRGCRPVFLDTCSDGRVSADQVADAITDKTALVSLMHVNNELGTINPLKEISEACRKRGVPFHSDCVQSVGKIPVDVKELGLDFLSMSGHKINGPKGVGVMYVRGGAPWIPWMEGGAQERGRRGGTSNTPGIVGLETAMRLAIADMDDLRSHYILLRKRLLDNLDSAFPGKYQINGPEEGGVPNIVNFGFLHTGDSGLDGEMLLLNLDIEGICLSSGSACTSGAVDPSHVLAALGLDDTLTNASLRISFGRGNTPDQVDFFTEKLESVLRRMLAVV